MWSFLLHSPGDFRGTTLATLALVTLLPVGIIGYFRGTWTAVKHICMTYDWQRGRVALKWDENRPRTLRRRKISQFIPWMDAPTLGADNSSEIQGEEAQTMGTSKTIAELDLFGRSIRWLSGENR